VLLAGVGSIGLLLQQLAIREGASVIAADPLRGRLSVARQLGAIRVVDPTKEDVHAACRELTEGRGADRAVVAAVGAGPVRDAIRATRPGAMILLFAQTHRGDEVAVDVGDLCIDEKRVVGSYSASVDEAEEAAEIVFEGEIDVAPLITHRLPLEDTPRAFQIASHPSNDAIKVVVFPEAALVEA
jgi:L-iditol 2-dehydrogenase